jgi:hypothetical protein
MSCCRSNEVAGCKLREKTRTSNFIIVQSSSLTPFTRLLSTVYNLLPTVYCLLFFTFLLPSFCFAQDPVFSNCSGVAFKNPLIRGLCPPKYGVVKRGGYLTFDTYSGLEVKKKNMLTHLKPQYPVIVNGSNILSPFLFVDAGIAKGWIKSDNVIFIDKEIFDSLVSGPAVILKKDAVFSNIFYPIATKFPLKEKHNKGYTVSILDDEGNTVQVDVRKELATTPLEFNRSNLSKITSFFTRKPYVWANSDKGWDCSGLLMDYFSFLGIQIPRNSYQQINFSQKIDVSKLSVKKKAEILRKSKPYLTLLYFPGHIMLYTGKSGKEYMSFQALNRVGKRTYARVGFFPLIKTGLLKRVTEIGYIDITTHGPMFKIES